MLKESVYLKISAFGEMDTEPLDKDELEKKLKMEFFTKFDEVDIKLVKHCHSEDYINYCLQIFNEKYQEYRKNAENQNEKNIKEKRDFVYELSGDMYFSYGSSRAMKLAAQGTIVALDKIIAGEWSNSFVLTRPPGHHARIKGLKDLPEGFCFFNNVAIGARYL